MPSDSTPDDSDETVDTDGETIGNTDDTNDTDDTNGDDDTTGDDEGIGDVVGDAQEAIEAARRRLAEIPARVVVTNHVMGLYELAAIHLSSATPDLPSAALAIDAVASIVDRLGDRLGDDAPTLRDALANIRLAFVQIKASTAASEPAPADDSAD